MSTSYSQFHMDLGDLHGLFRVSVGIKIKTLLETTNMKLHSENILSMVKNATLSTGQR